MPDAYKVGQMTFLFFTKITIMKLNDYKILFKQKLKDLFDTEETDALFVMVIDEVLNYSRADIVLKKEDEIPLINQKRLEEIVSQLQQEDRKSTRLNSSHVRISYAVFCLKKKKTKI